MSIEVFSFEDTVHSHLSIGYVDGCLACAQTGADMSLSAAAYNKTTRVAPAASHFADSISEGSDAPAVPAPRTPTYFPHVAVSRDSAREVGVRHRTNRLLDAMMRRVA